MSTTKAAEAYPLAWPAAIKRAVVRPAAKFGDHTVKVCVDAIKAEVSRLGGRYLVVSTNIPLRVDGDPYSSPGRLPDPGVAIYFQLNGKPYCMPCDKWQTVEDNLWAVQKNIEAMRGMQRWSVGSVEQAFAGFKQLTAGASEAWWDVLECRPDASPDTIRAQYRARLHAAHPDTGGTQEAMARLNAARDAALAERGA